MNDPRGVYATEAGGGNLPPKVPKKQKAVYTRINTERNGKSGAKQGERVYTRMVDTKSGILRHRKKGRCKHHDR